MSNAAKPSKTQAANATTLPLLLEIGCEEIPARFLAQAQKDFGDRLKVALEESRLIPKEEKFVALSQRERVSVGRRTGEGAHQDQYQLQTYSTPRRLAVHAPAILARQPYKTELITGPPVKVAVDAQGKYTRAAESFAQKNSANVADLIRVTTPKGEHLAVKKTTQGRPALEVLGEILAPVITGLNFPKSMYWTGKSGPRFVRPIRWILALLVEGKHANVIPFEIAGVKAGDFTFGHRAVGQNPIRVSSFKEYVQKLNQSQVELEPEKRRDRVRQECKVLLEGSGLSVVEDKALEDWIVNSTEWPRGLLGNFEERFLKLPREILVTVMRDHQKYFAVEDENGRLRPSFVTLLNVAGDSKGLICRGHERVLTARFSDAEFFWKADQKIPLRDRVPMLEKVTYQAKLGSYADKVRRMEVIARELCATLVDQGKTSYPENTNTLRAVQLCKCDLTTQMVQEFTELQGIVGGLYAKAQGEPQPVADAIYDHYLPQGAEDKCPRSLAGAVVSLADKIDGVAAGFAAGLEPTGSSDPFGLRRAGNGIVKILLEFRLKVSLVDLFMENAARVLPPSALLPKQKLISDLMAFIVERTQYHMEGIRGYPYDSVRAVMKKARPDDPADTLLRLKALQNIRGSEEMQALSHVAKRIKNILAKSATDHDWQPGLVDVDLLKEQAEVELESASRTVERLAVTLGEEGKYAEALGAIATLRPHVDLFFEKVLVMAENTAVKQNRLRLLARLDELFTSIADLSQIESSTSTSVDASTVGMTGAAGE